jgi:CheY-like chemotaxis protein
MSVARIMHVDDEPDIREVVQLSLELDSELTVRSCASGLEALALIRDWVPDLVLLDVMMPNMDGPTTLANLRREPTMASVPVVFMTARVQSRELDHFRSLGAAGVLAKPFDPGTLAESVCKFLKPKPSTPRVMTIFACASATTSMS